MLWSIGQGKITWPALCCDARAPSWTFGFGIVNSTALHCIIFLGPIMGIPLGPGGLPPQISNGRKATWAMCPQETLRQEVILVQHGLVLPKFKRWREFLGILRNPGMSMDAGRQSHHMSSPFCQISAAFYRSKIQVFLEKKSHFLDWIRSRFF